MNAVALEKLQFLLDIRLTSAESVQFFNHQRIAVPEHLLFQILIALTFSILSGAFVHNDIISADPITCESLDLPVLMLFPAGNTGIAKRSVVHKNTSNFLKKSCRFWNVPKVKNGPFGTGF